MEVKVERRYKAGEAIKGGLGPVIVNSEEILKEKFSKFHSLPVYCYENIPVPRHIRVQNEMAIGYITGFDAETVTMNLDPLRLRIPDDAVIDLDEFCVVFEWLIDHSNEAPEVEAMDLFRVYLYRKETLNEKS